MIRERYLVLTKDRTWYFRAKKDALAKIEELRLSHPFYLSLFTYDIPSWIENDDYIPSVIVT